MRPPPTLIGYVCDHCLDKAANQSSGHTTETECQICGEHTACHAVVAHTMPAPGSRSLGCSDATIVRPFVKAAG
jgi:hypothetical protein